MYDLCIKREKKVNSVIVRAPVHAYTLYLVREAASKWGLQMLNT